VKHSREALEGDDEFLLKERQGLTENFSTRKRFCMKQSMKSPPRKIVINRREEYRIRGNSDEDWSSSDDETIMKQIEVCISGYDRLSGALFA
ncbi:hypothetical protein Tcan_02391, partial [Toxocara canis]